MAFIYDLTDTWNAGGTTFNAIKMNVTDSASAAASKLVTLQVGGSERFGVRKDGQGYFAGNVGIGTSSPIARLDVVGPADTYARINDGTVNLVLQSYATRSSAIVGTTTNHPLTLWANSAERMRITSAGDVGIGTSSPGARLQVGGSTAASQLRIYGGAAGSTSPELQLYGASSDHNWTLVGNHSAALTLNKGTFGSVGAELMRIDGSGNLLVGTTSAGGEAGLSIKPNETAGAAAVIWNRAANSNTTFAAIFRNGNVDSGTISYTNTATSYNTSSDARLKENIAPADDAAALIDAIQVRKFDWKADGSHQRYGMVAQELLEVAPEAVNVPADEDHMMGVDYSKLVPMLIKEVQSLRARVAQLEGN